MNRSIHSLLIVIIHSTITRGILYSFPRNEGKVNKPFQSVIGCQAVHYFSHCTKSSHEHIKSLCDHNGSYNIYLVYNILIIIVTQPSTQLLVIHARFVLTTAPLASNLFRIDQFELPFSVSPRYEALTISIS